MATGKPPGESETMAGFDYFVVRVKRPSGSQPAQVAGLVELIGSGEKRPFDTAEHLVRLVTLWSETVSAAPPASAREADED
jgi:hypothetical protein